MDKVKMDVTLAEQKLLLRLRQLGRGAHNMTVIVQDGLRLVVWQSKPIELLGCENE